MLPGGLAPQASPSDLQDAVERALGAHGALAAIDPNHAERAVQRDMALAVAAAIEDREALVVEAGTGVGKTFAYLVPALSAAHERCSAPPPRRSRTSSSCATCRACATRSSCR